MLKVVDITKRFGSQTSASLAVDHVNLEIQSGEFFSLLGPSGCGKTTLLRILAGFETADSGQILLNGQEIGHLSPQNRPFNMVFQKYALFPHLSVFDNVAFGLRVQKTSEQEIKMRVSESLDMVKMGNFFNRKPETLSGGQAQRVALARAIVNRPKVLLLDEPLSALDQKMRDHMQTELRLLQKQLGITFVFVTHDQDEAMALSDRICVMNQGQIEQISSPKELYEKPRSLFCAQFVGHMNVFTGHPQQNQIALSCGAKVSGSWSEKSESTKLQKANDPIVVAVRPEKIVVRKCGPTKRTNEPVSTTHAQTGMNKMSGKVIMTVFKGSHLETHVAIDESTKLCARLHVDQFESPLADGDSVDCEFSVQDTYLYEPPGR
jgi:spermidine/putrescine transport system ATP-binding protein